MSNPTLIEKANGSEHRKREREVECSTVSAIDNPSDVPPQVLVPSSTSPSTVAPKLGASVTQLLTGVTLRRTGKSMPMVGLGTFRSKGAKCAAAVAYAVGTLGVRHVDTAEGYKNESNVAAGLKASGVPREDVFLTTKVSKDSMKNAATVAAAVRASLKQLDTTYLDLVLIHWPGTSNSNVASPLHAQARINAWKVLQDFVADGTVRHIGVSNFTVEHLRHLLAADGVSVIPDVNQVECHPYWQQTELREYCREKGIVVQSYTTLGRCEEPPKVLYGNREPDHPRLVVDPVIKQIAAESKLTSVQVLLRWALQRGMGVIPKATSTEHLDEDFFGLVRSPKNKGQEGHKAGDETATSAAEDNTRLLSEAQLQQLESVPLPAGYSDEVRYAYPKHKVPQ